MHTYLLHARRVCLQHGMVSVAAILVLLLIPLTWSGAGDARLNTQPLAFGPDQVIIDLNRLVWVPLKAEAYRRVLRWLCSAGTARPRDSK